MMRLFLLAILISGTGLAAVGGGARPNILWITAEDMSATLGCYGDDFATTPHIDRLAEESVRYTRAFATAPVCSPSRSCLITGCYAPSLGTMQMRSSFPIPEFMTGFPAILRREAGYFTTNNVKTDYNTASWERIVKESWNESSAEAHWRMRPEKSKPFFSTFNLMTSHQSRTMVWPHERFVAEVQGRLSPDEIHDPAKVPLPPYYVDTPVVRKTVARYYDCVTAMDKEVGAILKQLDDDGLADDTIVFFYSDHGSGMPRHKRALFDSGMHVPLLVRFPEKFARLAPAKPGEPVGRLVSFVDFAPTVLSLAGAPIPDYMQGVAFLGDEAGPPRSFVFGHRDRVDEAIDMARSVRDKRFLYIKNYMPHLGYNQPTAWPDGGEIRHEFYRLTDRAEMTAAQWQFAGPTRPPEELYDCEADPHNLVNLAGEAASRGTRNLMRRALQKHMRDTRDLGDVPEIEMWKLAKGTTPWESRRGDNPAAERLLDPRAIGGYWAAIAANQQPQLSEAEHRQLQEQLGWKSAAVRIAAADALARRGEMKKALPVLTAELESADLTTVLYAARAIELLGAAARGAVPAMEKALARAHKIRPPDLPATVVASGEQDLAMFIGFAAQSFLERARADGENTGEWVPLFDGESLEGWTALADGRVEAKDGEIRILAEGKNLWLLHGRQFADFELQAEVKMPPDKYNSGIGFRCVAAKGKPRGYQCEVAGKETGMIYAIGSGWVWPKGAAEKKRFREMAGDCFQPEEWNAIRIRAEADRIRTWVNGVLTADVRDEKFSRGAVALQHHGKGGLHRFRKIRIREIH
ncbi:MAG: sulfatase-like hydrolase/transferase [Akkermansiaceae bacterium]|nr:sulfatase-like hydrolase/transferase [Akkermansiaceae bacterium]